MGTTKMTKHGSLTLKTKEVTLHLEMLCKSNASSTLSGCSTFYSLQKFNFPPRFSSHVGLGGTKISIAMNVLDTTVAIHKKTL
mmetsp:Transcript_10364/g.36111  ORF Transcript_10364/g.36111 Transcript_10364/m.36111 type:complete len:83 (-) Transcript_10364:58-306(-)